MPAHLEFMQKALFLKQSHEIQFTSRIVFVCSIGIQIYWCYQTIVRGEIYAIVLLPLWIYITIFFINSFLMNVLAILVPPGWLQGNSRHCTNAPVTVMDTYRYPTLTILVPVYKESFATVIQPTLQQALLACVQYTQDTGVSASICVCDDGLPLVSEEEREQRLQFYAAHHIAWSERPVQGRRGKFKKAGNLNWCMNRSNIGDILLLLDSDSRISMKLSVAVREFADAKLGFLQMQTRPLYSSRPGPWESLVGHFTDTIYRVSFRTLCAFGEPSPLVGHNAFLRRSALQTCAEYDSVRLDSDPYGFQYFSEHHVSEDFELSMRLQIGGFACRYATYLEGFEEGVTFTALDEIIRLQKYAYGVNELTLHPLRAWRHGILCSTFKNYLLSDRISVVTKYNVVGYIGMYYALALAPIFVTVHYFAYHYIPLWNATVTAEQTLYACAVTFGIGTPLAVMVLKKKMGIPCSVVRELGCTLLFGVFFSGIGFPLLLAILSHFLGFPMSWSMTNKEMPTRMDRLRDILRNCYLTFAWSLVQIAAIVVGWYCWDMRSWQAIVPMAIGASAHLIVPFF